MAKEHKYDRLDLSSTVYVPYWVAGSPQRILVPAFDVAEGVGLCCFAGIEGEANSTSALMLMLGSVRSIMCE
jgi:hypothetical protein